MTSQSSVAVAAEAISARLRLRGDDVRAERWAGLFLFLLSLAYLCLFRRFTTMEPDEGILLQGAQRILAGQVLYRDFFSFYTPGSYYELAFVFRVFGSALVVARTMLALTGATISVIIYLLARRVCSQAVAITIAVFATVSSLPYRFLVLPNWNSTLWACAALYCAVRFVEHPEVKWAFALGSAASITMVFEQSKGAGLCLGLGMGLLAVHRELRRSWFGRPEIVALVLGLAWPLLLVTGYFAAQHSTSAMVSDLIWPFGHYSTANRVPFGYQNWSDDTRHALFGTGSLLARALKVFAISPCLWIPTLPVVVVGVAIYWITLSCRKYFAGEATADYLIFAGGYGGLALSTVAVRPDIIHFMYLQPLNCMALGWLLGDRALLAHFLPKIRRPVAAYVLTALATFSLATLFAVLGTPDRIVTRRGLVTTRGNDTVIEYVQKRVPAGETIVVYPYLPLYYYTTATFAPGRYDYFQPGMHTAEQASQMISEMARSQVKGVLLETGFAEKISNSWPNTSLAAVVRDPVADYILHNYRACQSLTSPMDWHFVFMVRKDKSCP